MEARASDSSLAGHLGNGPCSGECDNHYGVVLRECLAWAAYLTVTLSDIQTVGVSKVGAHKALLARVNRLGNPRTNGVVAGDGALEVAA
jgi:hypothetical protein